VQTIDLQALVNEQVGKFEKGTRLALEWRTTDCWAKRELRVEQVVSEVYQGLADHDSKDRRCFRAAMMNRQASDDIDLGNWNWTGYGVQRLIMVTTASTLDLPCGRCITRFTRPAADGYNMNAGTEQRGERLERPRVECQSRYNVVVETMWCEEYQRVTVQRCTEPSLLRPELNKGERAEHLQSWIGVAQKLEKSY
jgi:hypothetical protein